MNRPGLRYGPSVAFFVLAHVIQADENVYDPSIAAISARAVGALDVDDGCRTNSADGRCAFNALQVGQRGISLNDKASQVQAPELEEVEQSQQPWLFSKEQIHDQLGVSLFPETAVNMTAKPTSVILTWFCSRWVLYSWPKVAFWSQEVLRRTEALSDTPTVETQRGLDRFVRKAAYLMCVFDFDPQNGTEWSSHVADYMKQVRAAPSTSLDMPHLEDAWFSEPPQSYMLYGIDACMFWVTSNMCDLGHLARRLKGNKDLGDSVCWDQVPKRQYSIPFNGTTFDLGFSLIPTPLDFWHDEYLTCQEHRLTEEILDANCPMFGHYPPGTWGLSDQFFSWGEVPEEGSETYNGVIQCNAKIGVPEVARVHYNLEFPYADDMGIMETPEWKAEATKQLEDLMDLVFDKD